MHCPALLPVTWLPLNAAFHRCPSMLLSAAALCPLLLLAPSPALMSQGLPEPSCSLGQVAQLLKSSNIAVLMPFGRGRVDGA